MLEKYIEMFPDDVVRFPHGSRQEVANKMKKEKTRILYFEDVDGFSVVANLWAKRSRFEKVMGGNIIEKFLHAMDNPIDYSLANFDMRSENISLNAMPFPKYYRGDGGRYITSGVVFAEHRGKRNASFHRIMILDDTRAAIRLVPRDLYRMHKDAIEHGEELRIAVAIGLEPHVLLASATSTDYMTDELKIASALKYHISGERELAMRTPEGVIVPYNAEIVLSGRITGEFVDEGPFVDITGTYDIVRKQPVVVFEKMYYRSKILHLLLSGGYEHYNLMGMPREPTIYREIRRDGVNVRDVRLTTGGCSWLHCVVKIRKRNNDDGRRAIYGAFRGHHSLKHVVVVDEDIDIDTPQDVEFAIATRFQGDRDLIKMGPTRGSSLDPSSYEGHMTVKLGFDATMPIGAREKFMRVSDD
ncbi:MAG: UbiD family decarboxylase [Euryarchaeota archaeon]|nr:UbiD family decarboxylase [Euryarchaeota archaeon]